MFCGDRFAARELSKEFVSVCKKKREQAEYIYISPAVLHHSLEELLLGQGLFEQKYIVFCDEMLGDSSAQHLVDNLSSYHGSPHMFVIFEPSLGARDEKKFAGAGAVIKKCKEKATTENMRSLFAFVDTFLKNEKEKTFVAFYVLLQGGGLASSVLNTLLWQLRMLVLVSRSESAADAGVKPFVFTKAKRALTGIPDPFSVFVRAEEIIRTGRLRGLSDEDITEYLILSL